MVDPLDRIHDLRRTLCRLIVHVEPDSAALREARTALEELEALEIACRNDRLPEND